MKVDRGHVEECLRFSSSLVVTLGSEVCSALSKHSYNPDCKLTSRDCRTEQLLSVFAVGQYKFLPHQQIQNCVTSLGVC